MSPVRLTTGRAINPLRRPMIAKVRDLEIDPASTHAFPSSDPARIASDLQFLSPPVSLNGGEIESVAVEAMTPPELASLPAALRPADGSPASEDGFADFVRTGLVFGIAGGRDGMGPAELTRSYQPRRNGVDLSAEQTPRPLDNLRPLLEPSVHLLDGPHPALPAGVRAYQLQAVRALLTNQGMLLCDDPGLGKRVSAVLAMRNLFQRGRIQRALILTPESDLRHWAEILGAWAPSLLVTFVRGGRPQRRLDWRTEAHVYISDYRSLLADIERGALAEDAAPFDLLLFDSLKAVLRWTVHPLPAIKKLEGRYRWGLTGGLPGGLNEWRSIFEVLLPQADEVAQARTVDEFKTSFSTQFIHRSKADVAEEIPRAVPEIVWLDLNEEQVETYENALAEVRHKLASRGDAVTEADIETANERLTHALNFTSDLYDSVKVQSLLDRLAEITGAGGKVVVFSQFGDATFARLGPALKDYGAVHLRAADPEPDRTRKLDEFRRGSKPAVLLADLQDKLDGQPIPQASYVVHFDVGWDPGLRIQAEKRLFPQGAAHAPVTLYEFKIAGTVDEKLHQLLAEKKLLRRDVAPWAGPGDLKERLTKQDWLLKVFDVQPERVRQPARSERGGTTGLLPGTTTLRAQLDSLDPDRLLAGVGQFMEAMGFSETSVQADPDDSGGDLVAVREVEGVEEQVLVRCLRSDSNIGVGKARSLMKDLEAREELIGAFLVSTSDFTPATRKLAAESEGRLALVAGTELHRHLHILGWF